MTTEFAIDIFLTANIVVTCLTSFQKDVSWVEEIHEIVWNYARGAMIFDITATVPALFLD